MSGRDTIDNIRWLELRHEEERARFRRGVLYSAVTFLAAVWVLVGFWLLS
ncbi:MAG TPA: hypothetical protein VJ890_05945 [Vineibacter sp.]|jgi:hypothetical protein|nr:hypothetical protein [Vineibacter sp.]